MSDTAWTCSRCGASDAPRIPFPPYPGALGKELLAKVCNNCWNEWTGMQTKIINEYRLNVLDPGHAKAVRDQMQVFLGLKQQEG